MAPLAPVLACPVLRLTFPLAAAVVPSVMPAAPDAIATEPEDPAVATPVLRLVDPDEIETFPPEFVSVPVVAVLCPMKSPADRSRSPPAPQLPSPTDRTISPLLPNVSV